MVSTNENNDTVYYNLTFASSRIGVFTPSPNLLFALTQKVSKKVKTPPASLEKFAFVGLNPSKLVEVPLLACNIERNINELQLQTRTIFKRLPLLFFGSPAEVTHLRTASVAIFYL